ncbi:response regulator [Actinomyces gerencseriae]|uniref:response regulator transcription factor n=1 Tax=Actinomyces gerencseriae TaxID=52769 RepID=UPI000479C930|nr:response regulator transcription factor [Actinomyces gerencseriae]
MIRVGLADDDALVRDTLTELLATTEDIRVAWTACDGREALDLLRSPEAPDVQVLLLDVQMPRMDGITLAQKVREDYPEVGVLILTTFVADGVLNRALAAGVRGFIAKEDRVTNMADTIRNVAAGNTVLSPTSSAIIGGWSAPATPAAAPSPDVPEALPPGVTLSPRESEVLVLMVEALSNKQIATRLGLSETTVKTHVSALIGKLGVQDRVGAVVYALRNGLV